MVKHTYIALTLQHHPKFLQVFLQVPSFLNRRILNKEKQRYKLTTKREKLTQTASKVIFRVAFSPPPLQTLKLYYTGSIIVKLMK